MFLGSIASLVKFVSTCRAGLSRHSAATAEASREGGFACRAVVQRRRVVSPKQKRPPLFQTGRFELKLN